jgi:hypothetical protein
MSRIIDNIISKFKSGNSEGPHNELASILDNSSGTGDLSPGNTASTPQVNGIPVNILAFRTITKILGQLPRSTPIEAIDNLEGQITNAVHRKEIRAYDAFAHLAAGENDVAALTTNQDASRGHGTKLCVVACTQDNNHIGGTILPTSTPGKSVLDKVSIWYLMLTRNFRLKDMSTSSGTPQPAIISPSEPDDLGGRDAFAYMTGLEQRW